MKIFGWLADHSGCGWYRLMLPLGQLRNLGHESHAGRKFEPADLEGLDVFIAQRTFMPGQSNRLRRMAADDSRSFKIVYELDDDLWSVESRNAAATYFSHPEVRHNLTENTRAADLVTVSTEPLAEVVSKWNRNVVVLPNSIPPDMLSWRTGRHEDRFTVGWQGGPTHDRDWETAAQAVTRWFSQASRQQHPVEMHTVGSMFGHNPMCKPGCSRAHFPEVHPHRHTAWSEAIHDYYRSLDWHVALAPLADTRFNRSKSHIRVLEAAMLGFPVIASNVPAYAQFVHHGQTGFLVNKPADWSTHLSTLLHDPVAREEIGSNARKYALNWSIEATSHLWEEAYTE